MEPTTALPLWITDVPDWLLNDLNGGAFRQNLPVRWRIMYRLHRAGVDIRDLSICWPWPGAKNDAGYGRLTSDPDGDTYVHRIMYRECIGPIPAEHEIDHGCRNRACANPTHGEPVLHPENTRRCRTDVLAAAGQGDGLCQNGHVFEPLRNGVRNCRRCYNEYMREYNRAYRARRAAAGNPVK